MGKKKEIRKHYEEYLHIKKKDIPKIMLIVNSILLFLVSVLNWYVQDIDFMNILVFFLLIHMVSIFFHYELEKVRN